MSLPDVVFWIGFLPEENAQSRLMAIRKANFAATYTFRKESVQCYSRSGRFSTEHAKTLDVAIVKKHKKKELGIPWNDWKITNNLERADSFHSSRLVQVILGKVSRHPPLPTSSNCWHLLIYGVFLKGIDFRRGTRLQRTYRDSWWRSKKRTLQRLMLLERNQLKATNVL